MSADDSPKTPTSPTKPPVGRMGDNAPPSPSLNSARRASLDTPTPIQSSLDPPTNSLVTPLLTDLYQITMSYAFWKTGRHQERAVFELFFRKNPFRGEYTVFCGLDEVLRHLSNFRFSADDLAYLRKCPSLQHCDPAFFDDYLANLDCSDVKVYAMREGSLAFPRVPLVVVKGPMGVAQLLETTLLTLINYPSLIATNAARMVVAARGTGRHSPDGEEGGIVVHSPGSPGGTRIFHSKLPKCVEFGLRRAQGPDGGFSASKYAYVGGFDGTSNVQAGKVMGVPIVGTHAHSFVQSHSCLDDAKDLTLKDKDGNKVNLLEKALHYRDDVMPRTLGGDWSTPTNDGELAAFLAYAAAFPDSFLCLIDTYDTLRSGLRNFIAAALVLDDLGHKSRGVRLDSGDLAYLSTEVEKTFMRMAKHFRRDFFKDLDIVASNDINEEVLHSLNKQGHRITVFGIGTNLVTCQAQPALGCVYKLVEVGGKPRIKLSQDIEKVLIPGRKVPYRLFGEAGWPLLDVMVGAEEEANGNHPKAGERMLCRHPFMEQKRVAVTAMRVERLHRLVFDGNRGGVRVEAPDLNAAKNYVAAQLRHMRPDILRHVNPAAYKVSVSDHLFKFLHHLWQVETPIAELK